MTPDQKQQIDALIEAGEKALHGKWEEPKHASGRLAIEDRTIASFQGYQENLRQEAVQIENNNNKDFCKSAANTREALKAMRDYVERLEEALGDIRDHTDVDNPESYRCDDRDGCLDTVYATANKALSQSETIKEGKTND